MTIPCAWTGTSITGYEGAKDLAYLERNLFRYKGGVYTGTPENIRIYEGSNPKEELQYIVSEILR